MVHMISTHPWSLLITSRTKDDLRVVRHFEWSRAWVDGILMISDGKTVGSFYWMFRLLDPFKKRV